MVFIIILVTVAISIICFKNRELFLRLALDPYRVVRQRQYYRLVSHMFVHGGTTHLLVNMLVFLSFASDVHGVFEQLADEEMMHFPSLHLLTLYFGGGITAAIIGLFTRKGKDYTLSVGASGGVASVVFTSIFFDPWGTIYIFALLPIPGILFGAAYLIYSWRMAERANDNIDHRAHFYGALFGLLYPLAIDPSFLTTFFLDSLNDISWLW